VERCDLWVEDWTGQVLKLPGMAQAIAMRKSFEPIDGKPPKADELHYYATSAPAHIFGVKRVAKIRRGHWLIENVLHWRKDTVFREDAHVLRKGQAPIVLSGLRTLILGLFDVIEIPCLPSQSTPQKIAYLAGDVDRVLAVLSGSGIK
jgi:hypothetical protein